MRWKEIAKGFLEPLLDAAAEEFAERASELDVRDPEKARGLVRGFVAGIVEGARAPTIEVEK